ncbi:multidrug and toxin extrusion protein 1-like [Boleophthalmus pectinirostris]|uniref:multidrug and toxin extrusion protein 1-like n=1 Tax=Boleophthalmus pectinirostris TaxID=150288 RepID=UPI00242CF747|nr:multidrug and toxin extrusion protein 1-like [Boleophthalmus pectinirostris]
METFNSDRLFCCPWLRHRVPVAYRDELYHILRMTVPVLITRILGYLLPFVNTIFCGRLGNNVMAGYGLACAAINITTASTGFGLAVACDTLVSQTFGGKNLLRVGVILQRGILILMLFCLPCWALLINAEAILLCLGQEPEVARIAQTYMTAFIPAVPAMFLQQLQVSYLQNQVIILPQMFTAVAANIASALTNYILVFWLELGISGSAAANTMCHFYSCGFLFIYIRWKKVHTETWGGWSMEALQEWGSFMKLAIASTVMKCAEWWVYEFGGFFAGMVSENDLAAQHGVIMIAFITYMFPMGIQAATCARVGNALGAGNTSRAKLTVKVSFGLAVSFAIVEGTVLASTKHVIGYIFTNDEKIVSLISYLMSAYCFLQIFDGIVCVCTGIFVGTGKQMIPAVANLIGYYAIGLSMGIVLMFVAKLQTLGFWLGLLICVCIQSTFYVIIIIFKLNWKTITDEAVKRARKTTHLALLNEKIVLETTSNDNAVQTSRTVNTADGYKATYLEGDEAVKPIGHQGKGALSPGQLLLRRGLVALGAVAILALGVSVHFLVPLPESHSLQINSTLNQVNTTDPSTLLFPIQQQ